MIRHPLLLAWAALLWSCSGSKEATQATAHSHTTYHLQQHDSLQQLHTVDTSRTSRGMWQVTEVEFYPPDTSHAGPMPHIALGEQGGVVATGIGAIKRIRTTTLATHMQQQGRSTQQHTQVATAHQSLQHQATQELHTLRQPAPNPMRWRYIFYIMVLVCVVALVVYLRWGLAGRGIAGIFRRLLGR